MDVLMAKVISWMLSRTIKVRIKIGNRGKRWMGIRPPPPFIGESLPECWVTCWNAFLRNWVTSLCDYTCGAYECNRVCVWERGRKYGASDVRLAPVYWTEREAISRNDLSCRSQRTCWCLQNETTNRFCGIGKIFCLIRWVFEIDYVSST